MPDSPIVLLGAYLNSRREAKRLIDLLEAHGLVIVEKDTLDVVTFLAAEHLRGAVDARNAPTDTNDVAAALRCAR